MNLNNSSTRPSVAIDLTSLPKVFISPPPVREITWTETATAKTIIEQARSRDFTEYCAAPPEHIIATKAGPRKINNSREFTLSPTAIAAQTILPRLKASNDRAQYITGIDSKRPKI